VTTGVPAATKSFTPPAWVRWKSGSTVWAEHVAAALGGAYRSARTSRSQAGLAAVPVLNCRHPEAPSLRRSRSGLSVSPAGTAAIAAAIAASVLDSPMTS
jgi:hypothetical protein